MKNYKKFILRLSFIFAFGFLVSCTDQFQSINTDPTLITKEDASAKYFFTVTQVRFYGPARFSYWRPILIISDRYAGQFSFGHSKSWWGGSLMYSVDIAYSNAAWDYFSGNFGSINTFLNLTNTGGDFENPKMYAVGLIMKSLYFQMYTDAYGMIPFTETGNPDIKLPKFDSQKAIYQGIIADLDAAMTAIGSAAVTGPGVEDLGENDLFFNGDLQKWKRLANTLKLRLALRALGAPGADFADAAIQEALAAPLLQADENALLPKDTEISTWTSASYGDISSAFPGGGEWKISNILVETLKDSDDPRLSFYAQPAPGGTIKITRPSEDDNWQKRIDFVKDLLDGAGVTYTINMTGTEATITMAEDTYYVGAPIRLRSEMKSYMQYDLLSAPGVKVLQVKNEGKPIFPEIAMSAAESFFLQATAAVKGYGGNAQSLYQQGITEAMKLWGVGSGDISTYLASSPMATLSGSTDQKLEKIATQRWFADYTAGFEAWAVVRGTGYPTEVANGVVGGDPDIYSFSGVNGILPTRLRYGTGVQSSNGDNYQTAVSQQGADLQTTKLWFEKE